MEGDVGDERWWQSARQTARQLRTQWAVPTDYYSSVKVLTNEPLLKGESVFFKCHRYQKSVYIMILISAVLLEQYNRRLHYL